MSLENSNISPDSKKHKSIEYLEQLSIPDSMAVDLILVWRGLKKGVDIDLTFTEPIIDLEFGKIKTEDRIQRVEKFKELLRSLNLVFIQTKSKYVSPENDIVPEGETFYVAQNVDDANQLKHALEEGEDKKSNYDLIGRMSGF